MGRLCHVSQVREHPSPCDGYLTVKLLDCLTFRFVCFVCGEGVSFLFCFLLCRILVWVVEQCDYFIGVNFEQSRLCSVCGWSSTNQLKAFPEANEIF